MNNPHFEVAWVVTMPDKPSGRWMKIRPNIIKSKAMDLWLDDNCIKTPRSLRLNSKKYADDAKDTHEWIQKIDPDFIVVIAYGNIVPQHILDIPKFGPINVHGSILPEYRWASPLQSVFIDKRKETGLTIMKMFATLDTWDMIDKRSIPLPFDWTVKNLIDEVVLNWPKFLSKTLKSYAMWHLVDKPQNEEKATHCSKIAKEDWLVDPFKDTISDIYAKYKAYYLWPKIHFTAPDSWSDSWKNIIIDTLILDEQLFNQDSEFPLFDDTCSLHPAIKSIKLKPEWKKAMDWVDFKNGYIK